ncbi:MAG: Hsp70 family protein [Armatimonadetes bacterium]|nr:Hsp70 family protein [Armatimonadota bacterium]
MRDSYAIGIDLGTSTSEIAVFRNGAPYVIPEPKSKSPIIPSLVALDSRGELKVGADAVNLVDRPGRGIREVKRLMGSGERVRLGEKEYRPEEISALLLRHLKGIAEEALGVKVMDVVISVPANFNDAQRQATRNAGDLAGLNILRLINEPTAAALAFGIHNIDREEQIVVFDFGGGTLDITVLEMMDGALDVKSSFGDTQLGGKDFDAVMTALILSKFGTDHPAATSLPANPELALKASAQDAKVGLSSDRHHTVHLHNFAMENGTAIDLEVEVSREEFERECASIILDRARACVRQALRAGTVRPSAIDRVLMVGGTTYVPAVRQLVAEMFGKEPYIDHIVNPDLAVAMGASVQAAIAQGVISEEKSIILVDVASFGLGIEVVSDIGGQLMPTYEPLIQPNTSIPFSTQRQYSLLFEDQRVVELKVLQDHLGTARLPQDAVETGITGTIQDIPPSLSGLPHPVEVEFSYDIDATIHLKARIPATGQEIAIRQNLSAKRLSEGEKEAAREEVEELWKRSDQARRYEPLLDKAAAIMREVPATEMPSLAPTVARLKRAMAGNDPTEIEAAGDQLTDLLFDIENDL